MALQRAIRPHLPRGLLVVVQAVVGSSPIAHPSGSAAHADFLYQGSLPRTTPTYQSGRLVAPP